MPEVERELPLTLRNIPSATGRSDACTHAGSSRRATGQGDGIETDHGCNRLAESKSTGSATRLLLSIPKPLVDISARVITTLISTC